MLAVMALKSARTEVEAPDGKLYLIGPGDFARQGGGPFSIAAYPFGREEFARLRCRPTYVEPISRADVFHHRLEQLTDGIRKGTWAPPALSAAERDRLERRAAKQAAHRMWAEQHPVAAFMKAAGSMAAFVLLLAGLPVLVDLGAGRELHVPSPVRLLAFMVVWSVFLGLLSLWNVRRSARPD